MKSWRRKALLLAGAGSLGLLVAIPALSQEAPESLLPPGFGDPETLPPPIPKAPPPPPRAAPPTTPSPAVQETPNLEEGEELDELERRPINYFTIPEGAARPVDIVGPLEPDNFGLGPGAFGRSHGVFLATLVQRLDAPLPSRWTSILLRRALLSRVAAPRGVNPVDWVAVRADLLLRMGDADAARMLVQAIDQEFYTPRMVAVAAETALATSDPAGLCPLVGPADSREAVWTLAEAMCAALEGEAARASALADQARRQGDVTGIDFQLAEKVIGAGAQTRRAVTLEWDQVSGLNPWRFGLASATGAELPASVVNRSAPHIQAWFARAPMMPLDQRLGAASVAASLGVFSSRSLVEIYSLMLDQTDAAEAAGTVGARLRTAWMDRDFGDRLEAMRSLWREAETPYERYARLILTSGAAARIPPAADRSADASNLIASMLAAGMDRRAQLWSATIQDSGDDRAWAMLAVSAPRPPDLSADRIETFIDNDQSGGRRSQMLVAALAGLGRIDQNVAARFASSVGVNFGAVDSWGTAIDRAARDRESGTVALLAGIGMQTGGWYGVPPRYLFRILRALRAVGLDYEARMIAAEAVERL
jgi:hypothetical protein